LGHAPMPDAVGVVAMAVTDHVRARSGPGFAHRVGGGIELVEFDVGRDPQGNALAAGPHDLLAIAITPEVVELRVAHHIVSSAAITDSTGSTSAYLIWRSVRFA